MCDPNVNHVIQDQITVDSIVEYTGNGASDLIQATAIHRH